LYFGRKRGPPSVEGKRHYGEKKALRCAGTIRGKGI